MIATVLFGAVVIGTVVIGSSQRQDPFHFPFQASFNRFRLALSSSDSTYI